ncbi:MAG: hypothetical protein ISS92_00845 [Candidatus Omnitrophica bacterium]|nr:hypothetical protein [Candidatus Omnitrophota bacterium]
MRELIFKNLTTTKAKKKDISLEEVVERNGKLSFTKKRSIYFVRGVHRIKSNADLQEWVRGRKKDPEITRKFFHILRKYSAETKEDKLICKMRGSFYVIADQSVYNIVFVHSIKIKLHKA